MPDGKDKADKPWEIPTPPGEWGYGYEPPQSDPVLTAFMEGYNLPSPQEQRYKPWGSLLPKDMPGYRPPEEREKIRGWGEDIRAGWKELTRGFAALPKYRYDRATGKYIPIEPDLSLLKTIPEAWAVQATPPGEYSYEYPPVYGTYPESSPEGRQAVISAWEEETGKSWAEEKLRWEGTTLGPDAIPREILQWYTRTHPQYPEEAITAYAQRTIDEEPVNLPEDYESRSEAAKLYWLANNAYDVAIFDRFGRLLSKEEALYSARTEPGEVVTVGYFMGGDLVVVDPRPLSEAVQSLPTFMGREAQEREAQREEALSEATVALGVEEGEKNVEFEDKRAALLDNKDLDYHNMVARLNELVMSTFPPGPLWGTWQQKNREDAYNAQSPEQQKAWDEEHKFDQYADIIPSKPRPERPKPEPLDIGKLQESLATYGAGTTDNYPYISPMPESQLMRIPPETLELMARYLSEKGLSWREWLTISSEFYGGGGAGTRGRWAIPKQWGG